MNNLYCYNMTKSCIDNGQVWAMEPHGQINCFHFICLLGIEPPVSLPTLERVERTKVFHIDECGKIFFF